MQAKISIKRKLSFIVFRRLLGIIEMIARDIYFIKIFQEKYIEKLFQNSYKSRYRVFNYVNKNILRNEQIDYLEFGVYEGDSLKHWAELNTHSGSRFFGFDTFTGLPENWHESPPGTFSVGGVVPEIADTRVALIKGLFQETLPSFLEKYQPTQRIVVHLDADLYSSTLFVLVNLHRFLDNNSIIIFDEFGALRHEFGAFHDYMRSHFKDFSVICGSENLTHIAIRLVDAPPRM